MAALHNNLMTVIAASLLCGIFTRFTKAGTEKEAMRIICGMFLTIILLSPSATWDIIHFSQTYEGIVSDAENAANTGTQMTTKEMQNIIKKETETYIENKAVQLNVPLTVTITLDENNQPLSVLLHGNINSLSKTELETWLVSELGIKKENQIWTG